MSEFEKDSLEELLKHAAPRPVPSPEDTAAARAAVHEEWRQATATRHSRRRVVQYALAATVLLGVFAVLNVLRTPTPVPIQVASIAKTIGPVYILGEGAELRELGDATGVYSGQTMVTREDGGLALAWGGGGSLRVGADTRLEFRDASSVYLVSGRVYFDSLPDAHGENSAGPDFTLRTELGDVQHVGTQYMGELNDGTLVVSVREGEVHVDGKHYDSNVGSGQQVSMSGRQQPSVLSVSRSGEAWEWVHETMPPRDVDGETVHEFVGWVSRELGLGVHYEGNAKSIAMKGELRGTVNTAPADALRVRLLTAALDWRIEEGVIHISESP